MLVRRGLGNEREHSLPLGVFLSELLLIVFMLLNRPNPHLRRAHSRKQRTSWVQRQDCKRRPSYKLEKVIRARNQFKRKPSWNLPNFGSCRS